MKHVKKYSVVPENLAQQMFSAQQAGEQLTSDTPSTQLSQLDAELQKVLQSSQPADIKAKLYARILQIYAKIRSKAVQGDDGNGMYYDSSPATERLGDANETPMFESPLPTFENEPRVRLHKSNTPYGRREVMSPTTPGTSYEEPQLPSDSTKYHASRDKHRAKPFDRQSRALMHIGPEPSVQRRRSVKRRTDEAGGVMTKKAKVKYGIKRPINNNETIIKKRLKLNPKSIKERLPKWKKR